MMGTDSLRPLRVILGNVQGDRRVLLVEAAVAFEEAWLEGRASWPVRFQLRADMIRAALAGHLGPDWDAARLDDGAVAMLSEQLRRFCDEAERAAGEGRPG